MIKKKKDALDRTLWESGFERAYVMYEEYRLKLISFVIADILRANFIYCMWKYVMQ